MLVHGSLKVESLLAEKEDMKGKKKILVAVDASKDSMRAVNYVASIIEGQIDFTVCLLHVLGPVPPELSEFRGSEDPWMEEELEKELENKRIRWIETSKKKALPWLEKAKSIFEKARLPAKAIETEFWIDCSREGLMADLIEAGRARKCNTVVVGRKSFSWIKEIFQHHVADQLVRHAHNLTIWVVE